MLSLDQLRHGRFFMVFLASMVAMGPIAIDAYLPMMPAIAAHFQTDLTAVNLTMSSFLIGSAIGQFFGGALSDQVGRKRIGIVGLSLFCISTYFIIQSQSIESVQFFRLTQAIGSGFASVICLAQVRDLHAKEEVMKRFANVMLVVLLAPMLAPILGASMVKFGWQSLFALLGAWSFIVLITYLAKVPETIQETAEKFSFKALFTGYLRVINHRIDGRPTAIRFIIFTGFNAGVFMTFITNSALIYMEFFGSTEYQFAFIFAAHGLMLMVGNRIAVKLTDIYSPMKILRIANLLQLSIMSLLCLIVATVFNSIVAVLLMTLILFAINGIIMPTAPSIFIGYFDKNAGAAASLNTTTFFFIGAVIGAIAAVLSYGQLLPVFAIMAVSSLCAKVVLSTIRDI